MMLPQRGLLWLSLVAIVCGYGIASAQGPSQATSEVEAELAESVADTSWYDSETQQLRPVTVRERSEDAGNRNSRWLPKPQRVRKRGGNTIGGGGGGTLGSGSLGNVAGWSLLAICAIALIGLLVYFFSKGEMEVDIGRRGGQKGGRDPFDEDLTERMEHLPVEVRQQGTDMRGEAERNMRAGDFSRAIICLFGHQLLQLDRHQILRLARGKTNRQYIREANAHGESGRILQQTVDSFEASYFGRHAVTAERFEFLWKENERLENLLRQHREAAA